MARCPICHKSYERTPAFNGRFDRHFYSPFKTGFTVSDTRLIMASFFPLNSRHENVPTFYSSSLETCISSFSILFVPNKCHSITHCYITKMTRPIKTGCKHYIYKYARPFLTNILSPIYKRHSSM